MSKSDFATLCNVDKSRISHWIKDGRISGAALSGTGRTARIVVDVAQAQLKARLDPYQMLATGNGAKTTLTAKPAETGELLSDDAAMLMSVIRGLPSTAAWDVALEGGSLQVCFDIFANLRMNILGEMRMRRFEVEETDIEDVDWPGLAKEMGMTLIDPAAMAADWDRRRLADD